MSIDRRLTVFADDLSRTLPFEQQLKSLGFITRVIEPEETGAGKDTNSDLFEVVQGYRDYLAVEVFLHASGKNYVTIGAYESFAFQVDNWSRLLVQIRSNRAVKLPDILAILRELLPQANAKEELIDQLNGLNQRLHWLKMEKGRSTVLHANAARPGEIILDQLGGNKFYAMVGPKNIVWTKNGVQFDISSRLNKLKANRITIEIDRTTDEYIIRAWKQRGLDIKQIGETKGIQAAQLRAAFSRLTGMDTHL